MLQLPFRPRGNLSPFLLQCRAGQTKFWVSYLSAGLGRILRVCNRSVYWWLFDVYLFVCFSLNNTGFGELAWEARFLCSDSHPCEDRLDPHGALKRGKESVWVCVCGLCVWRVDQVSRIATATVPPQVLSCQNTETGSYTESSGTCLH